MQKFTRVAEISAKVTGGGYFYVHPVLVHNSVGNTCSPDNRFIYV